ncbi:MAG: nucleotidyltransferase family protein [Rikenellaceae bacterium]|jgi:hypothetical protein|nr:nucleotidyltransferase family protein [Rikenellaceae bacterium]
MMRRTERIAIGLLRQALGLAQQAADDLVTELRGLSGQEWREVYRFTVRHFVTAVVFDAAERLPAEVRPPRDLLLQWAVHADKVIRDNERIAHATQSLVGLPGVQGIGITVLKGAGLASLYPRPELRESCDVDIYTGRADDFNRAVRALGIEVHDDALEHKHDCFEYCDVYFENHRSFVNSVPGRAMRRHVDNLLVGLLEGRGVRRAAPADVPNPDFNALHIVVHTAEHFSHGAAHMRHLCDWALLLASGEVDLTLLRANIAECGLLRFADAMTGICIDRMGLPSEAAGPVQRDRELENRVMSAIAGYDGKIMHDLQHKGWWESAVDKLRLFIDNDWRRRLVYNNRSFAHSFVKQVSQTVRYRIFGRR